MQRKALKRCEYEGCNNLATVVGRTRLKHCLEHLTQTEEGLLAQCIAKGGSLQCSVFDGRSTKRSYPYNSIGYEFPKEADLKGTIFVNIDLNSADLTRVDFSFCSFTECDLRRSRLFNSSLRWSVFNQSLLRQADISNADCRWMDASYKNEDCVNSLEMLLSYLSEKQPKSHSKFLHLVGRKDANLFFLRHGFEVDEAECKLFEEQQYDKLLNLLKVNDSKQCWCGTNCSLGQSFCLKSKNGGLPETDWSGASFKDSDLAYSNFDNSIAYEVAFDGSDLHGASFCNAKIQRSSFINVSFSRVEKNVPYRSRFRKAQMQECVLDYTNMSGLYFQEANLNYAKMRSAHIENAVFFECSMVALDANDVIADGCKFYASDISSGSFKAASLRQASFVLDGENTGLQDGSEVHTSLIVKWKILGDVERSTKLIATNLVAADLVKANLNSCNLAGASLQSANLFRANLIGSNCVGTNFDACNVGGVDFTKANLTACSLSNAGINDVPPIFNETDLSSTNFSGMDLSNVTFKNSTMENANLADCSLIGARFRGESEGRNLNARRSSFSNTDFTGATFEFVDMDSCDMSLSVARETSKRFSFNSCKLSVVKFSGASLVGGDFRNCQITKSNLSDSYIEDIRLFNCNLESTTFFGSDLKNVGIFNPKSLSDVDFSSSSISSSKIYCDESNSIQANTVKWDKSYINQLEIANVHFVVLNADFSAFSDIKLHGVCFSTSSFDSAVFEVSEHYNLHFFYCKFPLAILKIDDELYNYTVLLGCDFIETSLPGNPRYLLLIDCYFRLSSFLATTLGVEKWANAAFVYCRFEDLKYFGLREEYRKINREPKERWFAKSKVLSFKEFLVKQRLNLSKSVGQLIDCKKLADRYPIAKRLKDLLPNREQLEREQGYGLTSALCREFRRDFKNHSLEELATHARVEEQEYLLKLKAYQRRSNVAKFIGLLSAEMATPLVAGLVLLLGLVLTRLSTKYYAGCVFLFPLVLILPAISSAYRLFASKHLYRYGEQIGTMAFSIAVCILAYGSLYYGFVPEGSEGSKLCIGANDCDNTSYKLVPGFLVPSSDDNNVAGCLMFDGKVLSRNGNRLGAFYTCIYYSGITFTTLGYGDITPQGVARYLALSEAIIGAFMIALLVFVFTKRDN